MTIKILVENTSSAPEYGSEHGLSIWIDTRSGPVLFDTGASDLFEKNAVKLGLKLDDVKLAILSHGHYDHGGGLKAFASLNDIASIYASRLAFGNHFSDRSEGLKNIGIDKSLETSGRIIFVDKQLRIDQNLSLFASVSGSFPEPEGNSSLLISDDEGITSKDQFLHEINLVVEEGSKFILIAGCAHKGILNIVEEFARLYKRIPDHVISGFHLYNRHNNTCESDEYIEQIGRFMLERKISCHTGHCTGQRPYRQLKKIMGDYLDYISAGSIIEL